MLTQETEARQLPTPSPEAPGFVSHWAHRLKHWFGMFSGTSYYHAAQGVGRAFAPREIKGYFNDLTAKTRWAGKVDEHGLPVSLLSNGRTVQFPILLCQKALGHWDLWLLNQEPDHRDKFLAVAAWLLRTQDAAGGWDTWGPMGQPAIYSHSAMTQGQAMSVLTRAFLLTGDPAFEKAAERSFGLMQRPVPSGGVSVHENGMIFLEEFPASKRDTVLNGWLFAFFGIYDYVIQFKDRKAEEFLAGTRASLLATLTSFDTGYWSYYSNGTRRLASPFYHRLHLSQLEALARVCNEPLVKNVRDAWTHYDQNRAYKTLAVLRKGMQKLREPRETTIVG